MSVFFRKNLRKYISALLVYVIVFSGSSFASENSFVYRSTLSPRVAIGVSAFSKGFEGRFNQEIAFLGKADKIDSRKDYAKNFYRLSFQTLFPQVIQRFLVAGIKSRILSKVALKNVRSIDVELKETQDPYVNQAYSFFQQTGEENLNDLVENVQLIDFLLKTIDGKRIDTVGFYPPNYKTESGKKRYDRYVRKWRSEAIAAVKGEPAGNFLEKPRWLLRKLYYRYILVHKFGDELRKSVAKGDAVIFSVTVTLEDGTLVQEEISIEKKQNRIVVQKTGEKQENDDVNIQDKEAEFLFSDLDSFTRQHLHILSDPMNSGNQINDFRSTLHTFKVLQEALSILSNKEDENFDLSQQEKLEHLVERGICWADRTPNQGGVREKQLVGKLLGKIILPDGYLNRAQTNKTIDLLKQSLDLVRKRMEWLIERIHWRNDIILTKAVSIQDRILYFEGLRNKIIEIQGRVCLEQMEQARISLLFLEQALSSEYEFYARYNSGTSFKNIMNIFEQMQSYQIPEQALALIEEVDFYVKQQADNLKDIYNWFADRGFDRYSLDPQMNYTKILSGIIKDLDSIQTPGRKYLDVINGVISKIDGLSELINRHAEASDKIKGVQEQIVPRLRGVRKAIVLSREKVLLRNEKLKQMAQRNYRYADVNDARNQLKRMIEINRASGSYNRLIEKIYEQLNELYIQASNMQQEIFYEQEQVKSGGTLNQLFKDEKGQLDEVKTSNELVLQAI